MSYTLGLDIGTTSSAAAINDGSTVRMLSVDHSAAVIPSVVHRDADGTVLVGAAAERRAISDPDGVARGFKRRFSDPKPLNLNGTLVPAHDLMVEVATALVDLATQQQGEAPEHLVVCHPAHWGKDKLDLLSDTLNNSTLPPHTRISEAEAAAVHYASLESVGDDEIMAVYNLGGGAFDVAVLRKTNRRPSGWEILGEPQGIERLGGIDFDLAVVTHVVGALGLGLDSFNSKDASTQAAVTRFRDECRDAKHALSSDLSTTVPVLLPGYNQAVRITRREFEQLIDPAIGRTIDALEVAVTSAGIDMGAIGRILLVGGSTRVPLVAARLSAATNRPVKRDAHPKHAMALGAAAMAALAPATPAQGVPKAAPSHTELYSLPHIDEQPLPEFMKGGGTRGSRSTASAPAPTATPTPAASAAQTTAAPATPAPATPAPTTMLKTQNPGPVGPVIVNERIQQDRRSPLLLFLLSFVVVGAVLAVVLFALDRSGSDDTSAAPTSVAPATTADADSNSSTEPGTFETSCETSQLPDPAVRYRVTVIPETFEEATLNGRNVPSTRAVDGVGSVPVTAFPELTELDLSYINCEVAENGRVWWGVNYEGPDANGADFNGIVWASTLFIEPVPS